MAGLVLVVGPSGAGKDTLIAAARETFRDDPMVVFPRRLVTRAAMAEAEDHDSISFDDFHTTRAAGGFALSWEAHGFGYALPGTLAGDIAAGRTVVANVSARVIGGALVRYPGTRVILVAAERGVRAARLARRGRESATEIEARLARERPPLPEGTSAAIVDNSSDLGAAVAAFCAAIRNG